MSWNPFENRRASLLFIIAVAGLAGLAGVEAWRLSSSSDSEPPVSEGTRVEESPVEATGKPARPPELPGPRPRLPLPSPAAAQSVRGPKLADDFSWLAALGAERMKRLEARATQDGLWGACLALGIYAECRRACQADPRGACVPKSSWDACLDWREDERRCRGVPGVSPP